MTRYYVRKPCRVRQLYRDMMGSIYNQVKDAEFTAFDILGLDYHRDLKKLIYKGYIEKTGKIWVVSPDSRPVNQYRIAREYIEDCRGMVQ